MRSNRELIITIYTQLVSTKIKNAVIDFLSFHTIYHYSIVKEVRIYQKKLFKYNKMKFATKSIQISIIYLRLFEKQRRKRLLFILII